MIYVHVHVFLYTSTLRGLNVPINPLNAGYISKNNYIVVCFLKHINSACVFMGNDRLSGKQVGSQASRRVTPRLAWIQPVCISINAVPALKGLNEHYHRPNKISDIT